MSEILERHDGVRALFDNRWLYLFAMNADGQLAWRYAGNLQWEELGLQATVPQRLRVAG
jgi:hypothetical protein